MRRYVIILGLAGMIGTACHTDAHADTVDSIPTGIEKNFPCNWVGNTTLELANHTDEPVAYRIRWAVDQNQSRAGTLAPRSATREIIGCGGMFTPGVWVRNLGKGQLDVVSH